MWAAWEWWERVTVQAAAAMLKAWGEAREAADAAWDLLMEGTRR